MNAWRKVALGAAALVVLAGFFAVIRRPVGERAPVREALGPLDAAMALEAAAEAPGAATVAAAAPQDAGGSVAQATEPAPVLVPVAEPEPPLTPEVAQGLDEAEAALEMGDLGQATFEADRALRAQKSGRAHAILTRIACRQGDRAKAQAALINVSARDRAAVVRECQEHGVDLQ